MSTKALFNRAAAMADESDQAPIIDKAQPLLFLANARRVASGFIANAFQSDAQRKAVFAKYGSGATSRLKKVADKSKRESDANGDKTDFRYGGTKDLNKQTKEQIAKRGASKSSGTTSSGGSTSANADNPPAAAGNGLASTAPISAKATPESMAAQLGASLIASIESGKIDVATTRAPWLDETGKYNASWGPLFSGPMKQAIIDAWVKAGGTPPDQGGIESIGPLPEQPAPVVAEPQYNIIQTPTPQTQQQAAAPASGTGEYALQDLTTPAPVEYPQAGAGIVTPTTPVETILDAPAGETVTTVADPSPHWNDPVQSVDPALARKSVKAAKDQAEKVFQSLVGKKFKNSEIPAGLGFLANAIVVAVTPETAYLANAFRSDSARRAFFAKGGARVKNPNAGQGSVVSADGTRVKNPNAGQGGMNTVDASKTSGTHFDKFTGTWSYTPRPVSEQVVMGQIAGRPEQETVAPGNDTQGSGLGTSAVPVNNQTQRQQTQLHQQTVRAQQNAKAKADGQANMDNLAKKAQRDADYFRKQAERADLSPDQKNFMLKRAGDFDKTAAKYSGLLAKMGTANSDAIKA